MNKKELLTREYTEKFEKSKCTYFVKDILISNGASLSNDQDIFIVKELKESVKNKEKIIEETEITVKFSSKLYKTATIKDVKLSIGDELKGTVCLLDYEVEDNLNNLIYKSVYSFSKKESDLHPHPIIPESKLTNALTTYGNNVDKDRIAFLYDATLFGNAKEGFLISDTSFMYNVGTTKFNFRFVDYVESNLLEKAKEGDSSKTELTLTIELKGEKSPKQIELVQGRVLDLHKFKDFLELTKTLNDSNYIKETDGYVIIQDLPDTIKQNYLKAIVCFTCMDDGEIDSSEVSEIQTLMTQLELSAELREQVRTIIVNPLDLKIKDIVHDIDSELKSGSEHAIHVSLMKDIVRVHSATKETDANTDPLVNEIAEALSLSKEQLDFIHEAYLYDKKILSGDISDDDLTKGAKILATKAGAVGVPIAAIYLSGSVAGLSAAGLTSGLAALGLGGVLGLSSMVTGIGAVVLLGVGVYKGLQWALGSSERDKASRREFMLQEVLRIHQKTISNLAEDVNFFALKIVDAVNDAEGNKLRIQKLAKQMTLFSSVIKTQKETIQKYESDLEEESSKRE